MDLRDYFRVARTHWIAIVLCAILGVALAAGVTLLQPRVYTADSSATVSASGQGEDLGTAVLGDQLAKSRITSYLEIGRSRAVAQYAIDQLGLDMSAEALVQRVSVSNPLDSAVIVVNASASTPEAARDLAEAWIAGIADEVENRSGGTETTNEAGETIAPVVTLVGIDSAVLPTSPSSPNTRQALVIGFIGGLVVGAAYALLKSLLDRRIRRSEVVEKEFGLPVVGTIPISKAMTVSNRLISVATRAEDHDFAIAESMRELRTNLQFMDVDHPPRVIVMTSPLPGDGKSSTIANLAATLAVSGEMVVIIDADLRRPTLSKIFHLVGGVGLTDVLIGRADLADVLQPYGDTGRLMVMGAGLIPPNPSELLGSQAMKSLLDELSREAFVLIDAPPLIPVTDAAILTAKTDGALIVVGAGKTTTDELRRAIQSLQRVKGRALGVILNRVPRRGPHANGYGYGSKYGYKYGYANSGTGTAASGEDAAPAPLPLDAYGIPASTSAEHSTDDAGLRRSRRQTNV